MAKIRETTHLGPVNNEPADWKTIFEQMKEEK